MSMDDGQLERTAKRLGATAAARLDVDRTARVVVERLRLEPEHAVWWRRTPVLSAVAAAAVIVMAVGILIDSRREHRSGSEQALAFAPIELQALSDDELEEVYDSLAFEAPVSELIVASLEEMSVGQLEELLRTMMEE